MQIDGYNPKHLKAIGRFVYEMQPTLASSILSILRDPDSDGKDIAMIPDLFERFLQHKNVSIEDIIKQKKESIYLRMLFVSIILKIYNPQQLIKGFGSSNMKRGLREELSKNLQCDPTWISKIIPQIAITLKIYDDFKSDFYEGYEVLKNHKCSNVTN